MRELKDIMQEDRTVWKKILEKSVSGGSVEDYVFNKVYGDALKQTEILTGKMPWYAKWSLLKPINGYHEPLEKLEKAAKLAIEQRNRIEGVLGSLYDIREKKLEFREHAIQKTAKLKDNLEQVRGEKKPILEKVPEETYKPQGGTGEMQLEDYLTKQAMTTKANGDALIMIDSIIVVYRDLLLEFNKRAELGTALFKTHGGMLKW